MEQEFFVLKDAQGYYPMAFISPADKAGEIRKEQYKLREGDEIVTVRFVEVKNY